MDKFLLLRQEAVSRVIKALTDKGITLDVDSKENRLQAERYGTDIINRLAMEQKLHLTPQEFEEMRKDVAESCFGYGPLQVLLNDSQVTDIMVNGPTEVYVEKNGILEQSDVVFKDEDDIAKLVNRMLGEGGKRLDRNVPFVDIKIKESARVTAVIPPISADSISFVIRKKMRGGFTFQDFLALGTINEKLYKFLQSACASRLNILITGSTGAGKTTLLNLCLKELVPKNTRVVVLEDTNELLINGRHALKLLTRGVSPDGKGEISLHDLVKLSLHLRPDRLVIGEIRGEEVFSLLQAVNTGHDGSMCTIHANSSRDAIGRLEMLSLMARSNIDIKVIRRFIKSGIDLVVHMTRFAGGKRMVAQVSELVLEGDELCVKNVFDLKHSVHDGKETHEIVMTGYVPSCIERLKIHSDIKEDFFTDV